MFRCPYFGAWRLLTSCLGVFVVTTAAPRNINLDIQPRQETSDATLKILHDIHGKTFAFPLSSTKKPLLVDSTVSCFTIQMLYSAEETDHTVMLWLQYTKSDGVSKRVDTITFAVKTEEGTSAKTLRFDFEGSSNNGITIKEAEFGYPADSCYVLKIIFKDGRCVFLGLPSSSGTSAPENCVSADQRGSCEYEGYESSDSEKCLEYKLIEDSSQRQATEVTGPSPDNNQPLLETDAELQQYQDFKRGLLFSSLVLVYSSFGDDPFRFCMITYSPNKGPGKDGKLYILTSGVSVNQAMVQAFNPYTLSHHNDTFRAAARLYRDEKFYETKVIFTDRKQCIILRTPGYHNLCELFTGGRYTNGILNSICFFIYAVYCKQPATRFTSLGECWPPAKK
uniref:Putative salivary lipocalin n=1 Tax=Ixodes ricinus TaxID=34613 RepID=A0A0K8RJA0_IXORI